MHSIFSTGISSFHLRDDIEKATSSHGQLQYFSHLETSERIRKNLQFNNNYSKTLKYQLKIEKSIWPEYQNAKKQGNTLFVQAFDRWKTKTLFGHHHHSLSNLTTQEDEFDWDEFFKEGREPEPGLPNFLKETILDFAIFVAFFYKFISRIYQ